MPLQLILGSSGSGKSHTLYHGIIEEAMKHNDMNYLVIVPEQFTMQTQKDFVSMHPNKGIMNIDILSFMRLAYRIFEETGREQKPILEDTGKSILLRKVVERKKEELKVFQNNVKKQGFISELKSLLSEIFQYSIQRDQIEEMIAMSEKKPLLQRKLADMLIIYDGFRELLSEKYITAEEILDVLGEVIEQSSWIRNSVLCFDGFTGFTPSQYKILTKLMKLSKKVMISITIDPRENYQVLDEEFKLFHLSKKTILKLQSIAREEGVECENPIVLSKKPYRFQNSEALAALEANLFRYPWKPYAKEQQDISLHSAYNMEAEVCFTVKEIFHLIREKGYRYRDIAVVTGDIKSYARVIEKEYAKAKLPCFIDYKKEILSNPLIAFIKSTLEMLSRDFHYESIFAYLRCGLVGIKKEEIDILENYVLALGIKGYHSWNKIWTRVYRKDIEIDLERMNAIREKVMQPLIALKEEMQAGKQTVLERTTALNHFLVSMHTFQRLQQYEQTFQEQGKLLLAKEYGQIYGMVLEIFDRMVELLGEESIPLKEYIQLLETGFAEAKVGVIPPGIDQIVVGDIERTRLNHVKALFFLGVNDGIIPKAGNRGGIISDMEREVLAGHKMELAPTKRQSAYTEQFYLYLNLTKPKEKLYVTYHKVNKEGKTQSPSYLIGKLQKLFPKLSVQEEKAEEYYLKKDLEEQEMQIDGILGADSGRRYLLEGLRQYSYDAMPPQWKELFSFYYGKEDWKEELIQLVEAACYKNEENGITKAVANVLYGKELHNSVTRVEQYAACAFAHFLNYGLHLRERQEYQLRIPDIGNIFHSTIELFSNRLREMKQPWRTLSDEQRESLVEECIKKVTEDYGNTILKSTKRNEYMIERMERMTKRTIWALCEHIKKGKLEPSGYELSFSYMDGLECIKVPLSEDETMRLMGRIDRVDTLEEEEGIYVKVIDYKSGGTSFQLEDLYYGLQMQLVVYLNAALEIEQRNHPTQNMIPAGIFYYNISDPIVNRTDDIQIEEEILKELKMNGLINRDTHILQLLDSDFGENKESLNGSVKSKIMPVETGKDGTIGKRSNVARTEDFYALTQFVGDKIKKYGKEILDGHTEINPYKMGEKTACDYCSYSAVCSFDKKLPGNQYRTLKKMSEDEIWKAMSLEENGCQDGE